MCVCVLEGAGVCVFFAINDELLSYTRTLELCMHFDLISHGIDLNKCLWNKTRIGTCSCHLYRYL